MKINREELKEAVLAVHPDNISGRAIFINKHGIEPEYYIGKAAVILLQITDPEYVPTEGMTGAGYYAHHNEDKDMDGVFRAMIAELVDG